MALEFESSRCRLRSEAIVVLVPAPDFKSGGGCGDTSPAGSIPVRFRQSTHKIKYLGIETLVHGLSMRFFNCAT